MKRLVLGPTFTLGLDEPAEAAARRLDAWTRTPECPFRASSPGGGHFLLSVRTGRHFWSPWLTLDLRPGTDGAEAFGRFNPSPAIWTAYMLGSLTLITTAFGAGMWGVAEIALKEPPLALWIIPVCAAVLALMWWASAVGQRLARDQMDRMRAAVDSALKP